MLHPLHDAALALLLTAVGAGAGVAQTRPPITLPSLAHCERGATGFVSLRRQAGLLAFLSDRDGETVRLRLTAIQPAPGEGASDKVMDVDEGRLFLRFSPEDGGTGWRVAFDGGYAPVETGWTIDGSYRVRRSADGGYDLELQPGPGMACPIGSAF